MSNRAEREKQLDWLYRLKSNLKIFIPKDFHLAEFEQSLDYAISSIKTDLKYDLLYEETKHIADADKMIEPIPDDCETCIHNKGVLECDMYACKYEPTSKNDIRDNGVKNELNQVKDELEPTTKTCRTCKNFGTHHGICEICKDYGCWTEQEPTTKNDLGVKLISKSDVDRIIDCPYFRQTDKLIQIMNLPSVTPQEPIDYKAQYERFSKKSEVVISQLRADRNRLLEVLDKLRAEIERQKKLLMIGCNAYNVNIALDTIKLVIDKYKAENEPQESEV